LLHKEIVGHREGPANDDENLKEVEARKEECDVRVTSHASSFGFCLQIFVFSLPTLTALTMARNVYVLNKTWDDRVVEDIIVIWDRWEPACDSCGCLESSLGGKLFCCSYCRVARYCSVRYHSMEAKSILDSPTYLSAKVPKIRLDGRKSAQGSLPSL
jgi:hypothetical protein